MAALMLAFSALLIGISKAGFGGGMGVLVGPLLTLFYPAKDSVGLMLPLLFACDVLSLYFYWGKWDRRNALILTPGALVGIVLGGFALNALDNQQLAKVIGGMAIVFALLQVVRGCFRGGATALAPTWWFGTLVGVATGFVSTLSHVGGLLTTMYLLAQKMDSVRFVGTTTLVYFFVNLAKIPVYIRLGVLHLEAIERVAPFVPIVLVGTALGVLLNRLVSGVWFGRIVLGFVMLAGLRLLFE